MAKNEDKEWKKSWNQFIRNRRSMPHPTIGVSRIILLFCEDRVRMDDQQLRKIITLYITLKTISTFQWY